MTLTELKQNDENKIKTTIVSLTNQIRELKINEFKNSRYIEALEAQIKELSNQLKQLKQEPKFDLTTILREINDETMKARGLSKKEMEDLDKEIETKIKGLMS